MRPGPCKSLSIFLAWPRGVFPERMEIQNVKNCALFQGFILHMGEVGVEQGRGVVHFQETPCISFSTTNTPKVLQRKGPSLGSARHCPPGVHSLGSDSAVFPTRPPEGAWETCQLTAHAAQNLPVRLPPHSQ